MPRITALGLATALIVLGACGSDDDSAETSGPAFWSVTEPVSGAEFDIVIEVGSSSCDSLDRVIVDETSTTVTIEAIVRNSGDEICTMDMVIETETITLDEPLGDRELLGCDRNVAAGASSRDCSLPGPG